MKSKTLFGQNTSCKRFFDEIGHLSQKSESYITTFFHVAYQLSLCIIDSIRTIFEVAVMHLYRLDKQYSPISAIASLYYLFDTIGIYSRKHSG